MAKYRRRRYGFKRKIGKWAPNILELGDVSYTAEQGSFSTPMTIATNPVQSTLGVSQIYTVKNFDITFTIESPNAWYLEAITAYIMFVPQGMQVTNTYNIDHPEYILNYKYLGSPTGTGTSTSAEVQQYQPFRIRTGMSRKLNTGDTIILFLKGLNQGQSSLNYFLSGVIRWWTKAN